MELKNFLFGKISRKFLSIFIIIIFAILFVGGLIVYFQGQVLDEQFFSSIVETEEDFVDIKEESIRTLSAALEVVLRDESLKKVYLEKDRKKLFDYGQPLFQELKSKYAITHFYFILPDGYNFVRLHNEEKFGDLIERATFIEARDSEDVGAGIELGKTAYALRVVMPYYDGDELIGYVELGQEIDEFFDIMKKDKNNKFSLIVEKDSLSEEDWASVRESHGFRNNWDDLGEHVIISSTVDEVFSCFSDDNVDVLEKGTSLLGESKLDGNVFACGGFALVDAFGEKSGAVFSLIDVTNEQTIMSRIRIILLSILFVIVLVFVGFLFLVSRNISKPIEELAFAAGEIGRKNFKARVDIRTGDELQRLGETFNETANVLEGMDKEYKQLEKAKTEFLSITSHELRSPMTPMQAQLQMLLGDYYGKLNAKQKSAMEIVSRNTKRLDNIIVDFLEISRIEAARLKFRFVKDNPGKVIPRLIKEMSGFMPEKKVKIVSKVESLPIIEHDPDRLSQVLRNLMNNAIKFSKAGTAITVSGKRDGNMLLFSVADEGIGMKAEDTKRIFEPFFQAEQTMYREHQGTGLGLAIVKGIVESQGGKVWLKSIVGKGTTFYFTLPLKPVKKIKPIKLLFSEQEDKNRQIKEVFVEILGPMGNQEFESLERKNQLSEKDLVWYVGLLVKKGILDGKKGEVFKGRILNMFGGDGEHLKVFDKTGFASTSVNKIKVEDLRKGGLENVE